ncbi:hypothetical protein H6F89_01045 [Cyanobacteria bacterium FACHB-63]|nr:hypothetical protein [Cyanobacteria bacterium FACHB-63]
MRLLCLSNGHGEDTIAIRILQALQQKSDCKIEALPIVGEGYAYRNANIPVIGSVKVMPSGGFIYMDNKQLVRDIQGGLVKLTLEQIKAAKNWAKEDGLILAVGDIVPMLFAWMSRAPFAFVATARSQYYIQDEKGELPRKSWWDDRLERSTGCIYHPLDRWLMKRPQCKAVFPRDRLTAQILKRFDVPAFDLGNPMMDGLEWSGSETFEGLTVALIPGSRPPECFANWELMLQAIDHMSDLKQPVQFLSAIAPGIDLDQLHELLVRYRWRSTDSNTYVNRYGENQVTLKLMPGRFAECIQRSEIAIAMAGTATEQFIGLGKPALIMPGAGPQFTPAFAEAQTRLLGASVTLVSHPSQMNRAIRSLLENPDRIQMIAENGRRRMGEPGAAERISDRLIDILHTL